MHKIENHQVWHYEAFGKGQPIVLLHGIGLSHEVWRPIIPFLSKTHRVIAVDIAGFGQTPPLPPSVHPTIPHLVEELKHTLQAIGIDEPVVIVGNSLGGVIALEAAKHDMARSIIAISPGGLWKDHLPLVVKWFLLTSYTIAKIFPFGVTRILLKPALLRELLLMVPISRGSRKMPVDDAIQVAKDITRSTAFKETLNQPGAFHGGKSINIPVTVAFGKRDYLLTKRSQYSDALPAQTQWKEPKKWGHVPMWIDPEGVAKLIIDGIP